MGALNWFELRFTVLDGRQLAQSWKVEIREDATEAQQRWLREWLGQDN
jgi:hypothetical protein